MVRDLRYSLRLIGAHPWFSAAVVAALALGIGVNTTVFGIVNAVLFRPLPFPGGERLVIVANNNPAKGYDRMSASYPEFLQYRAQTSSFEALEAASGATAVLSERGNPPEQYAMAHVTPGMFEMLSMPPMLGRGFTESDGQAGAEPVLLLGHGVWQSRYGGSPEVVGRPVRVNGEPATIIGVMPEGFRFPQNQDMWMALAPRPEFESFNYRAFLLVGMLKRGVSRQEAAADLAVIAGRIAAEHPDTNQGVGTLIQTFHERYNAGEIRRVVLLMQGAVAFVLLIACANVANMLLSRALARRREMSIRAAMGASRWQVIRQLLTESVLLSAFGGVVGLVLATLGTRVFAAAVENVQGKPYWIDFSMDWRVLSYFASISVLSGVLFGLAPALESSRVNLTTALKDGTRTAGSHHGGKLTSLLVVFQFTLAVVLLTGAGLFIRGFLVSRTINPDVPYNQTLVARARLPQERYPDTETRQRFYDLLLPRVAGLPGVTAVATTSSLPGLGGGGRRFEMEGAPVTDESQLPSATAVVQSPGYFDLINLPILTGRDFDVRDGEPGHEAAVVTRDFAARFSPGQEVLGRRFRFRQGEAPGAWITVVGVSADILQNPDEEDADPVLFVPYRQEGNLTMNLLVRASGDPATLGGPMRAEVERLDPDLALFDVMTLQEFTDRALWYLGLFSTVFSVFALIALVLASVGIYGVIAQSTGRRTQEIGVRMALGATGINVVQLVMARGVIQLAAGLVLGLAGALAATRLTGNLLFQTSPWDPTVFVTVVVLLAGVGLFASWLPARRAATLDPVKALRYE